MALYFFHLHECGTVTRDSEGRELADMAQARAAGLIEARSVMADEGAHGRLCLACHIQIEAAGTGDTSIVHFHDAVVVTGGSAA